MKKQLYDGYGTGTLRAWWFRWHEFSQPGLWDVGASFGCGVLTSHAVVDDFGNLVGVIPA